MATQSISYSAYATFTISPENVATSPTRVAGVESTAIDNTSNLYVDALVAGKWTAGTSPTGGFVDIWVYGQQGDYDGDPTYPDVITGSTGARTFTDENSRNSAMKLAATIALDTTSNQEYEVAPFSVAELFGGRMPKRWGLWISHSSGVNSHSTAGNHEWQYTGIKYTSA